MMFKRDCDLHRKPLDYCQDDEKFRLLDNFNANFSWSFFVNQVANLELEIVEDPTFWFYERNDFV